MIAHINKIIAYISRWQYHINIAVYLTADGTWNGSDVALIGQMTDTCFTMRIPYTLVYKSLSRISRPFKKRVFMWSKIVDPRISRRWFLRACTGMQAWLFNNWTWWSAVSAVTVQSSAGMGSSRTGLDLEDSSRTKFCGLGLGLEDLWPWPWPRPRPCCPRTHPWSSATAVGRVS